MSVNSANINLNPYQKVTGSYSSAYNNSSPSIFVTNETQNADSSDALKEQFNKVQDEQGFLGKAWNGIKNFFHIGLSSDDVEEAIQQYENGEISYEEAQDTINTYGTKQDGAVNIITNTVTGLATAGIAVATGGIGALAAGAAIGGATKAGIKTLDRATNNVEGDALDVKQIAKDGLTGAVDGLVSAATAGMVKAPVAGQTVKEAVKQGVVQGAKAGAISGAATGAADYTVEAALEEDVDFTIDGFIKSTAQNAVAGGVMGGIAGGVSSSISQSRLNSKTKLQDSGADIKTGGDPKEPTGGKGADSPEVPEETIRGVEADSPEVPEPTAGSAKSGTPDGAEANLAADAETPAPASSEGALEEIASQDGGASARQVAETPDEIGDGIIEEIEPQEPTVSKSASQTQPKTQTMSWEQQEFMKKNALADKILDEHFDEFEEAILNPDGTINTCPISNENQVYSFDELIQEYDGEIGKLYHATSAESKAAIMEEGFRTDIAPKHGYLDGVGGTYFTTDQAGNYGDNVVTAIFKGKVAKADTDILDSIKKGNFFGVSDFLESIGVKEDVGETLMLKYLQRKIKSMGYQGIMGTNYSCTANCTYFSALDPDLIEIIS